MALVILLLSGLSKAAEEFSHPEITLLDYDGNEIALDSNIPYSPKTPVGNVMIMMPSPMPIIFSRAGPMPREI